MEIRKLSPSTKIWKSNGITIAGNSNNGAVIGLDKKGENFISELSENGLNLENVDDEEKRSLVNALETLGYFGEQTASLESAYIHVTDKCNLHCVGCYSYITDRNNQIDMTTEQINYVLDELSKQGVKELVISGGEPFLRNDIIMILKKAKSANMRVCIISNGTLNYEKYLPALPFIDTLSISVDGYARGINFIRDKGTTERVLDLVDKLKDNVRIHLIFTLHKKNVPFIDEYVTLAENLKVSFNFSIFTVDPHDIVFKDYLLDENDLEIIVRKINEGDNIYIDDTVINGKSDGIEGLRCTTGCKLGCKMISIAANGNIYPCHMLHNDFSLMGNIFSNDLHEIISNKDNIFRELSVDDISECSNCQHKYFCGGGCRGRSYLYYGNYISKDPFCILTKKYLDERTAIFKSFTE